MCKILLHVDLYCHFLKKIFAGLLPLGRVPPGFLVGEGARDWAQRRGVPVVSEKSLISDKAAKLYKHYKKKLDSYRQSMKTTQQKRPLSEQEDSVHSKRAHQSHHSLDDRVTDTVGVVVCNICCVFTLSYTIFCVNLRTLHLDIKFTYFCFFKVLDKAGRVASTVSSGGIALKQPGRVGQASVFGCGCWAQRAQRGAPSKSSFSVGISTTGCGEHLVRTFLARECAQHLSTSRMPLNALQTVMKEKFAESDFLGKFMF